MYNFAGKHTHTQIYYSEEDLHQQPSPSFIPHLLQLQAEQPGIKSDPLKSFIKVVNFSTINNYVMEHLLAQTPLGGNKIQPTMPAPNGCDLVFNIENNYDWQCGVASIFHGLLQQMMMKRKRKRTRKTKKRAGGGRGREMGCCGLQGGKACGLKRRKVKKKEGAKHRI